MSTILVVDDEHDFAATVACACKEAGWTVVVAHDGAQALALARRIGPDAILLDLVLPDMSGTEVCRQLRADSGTHATPILMLTARCDEIDRIVGFEVGADDYLTKAVSLRELVLRIKAQLRRAQRPRAAQDELEFGVLRINKAAHQVWVDNVEIQLTALEFRLLWTLLSRRGRVQSREVLLDDVWGQDPGLSTRTVDTHMQRLRSKLAGASGYLETLRGTGYRCRSEPTANNS